jgi:1-acyl-sn-glycerol-3-phosphate acyltransferase
MPQFPAFRPAKPWRWVIGAVGAFLRFDLSRRNRLRLDPTGLDVLRALPQGAGVILAANHADETDFKVCLELSRRCGRRFLFLMNHEAFDEGHGLAGWWLQRLGAFSVERGGLQNEETKRYAIEVVKRGLDVLVIFPEGEIYYLNDLVQPFKSGAVDIAMQASVEARRTRPDWTAYLVPMALKYRYREPVVSILERRTRAMEQRLNRRITGLSLQRRLAQIMADLLGRHELARQLKPTADRLTELDERVQEVRKAILSQTEARYAGAAASPHDPVRVQAETPEDQRPRDDRHERHDQDGPLEERQGQRREAESHEGPGLRDPVGPVQRVDDGQGAARCGPERDRHTQGDEPYRGLRLDPRDLVPDEHVGFPREERLQGRPKLVDRQVAQAGGPPAGAGEVGQLQDRHDQEEGEQGDGGEQRVEGYGGRPDHGMVPFHPLPGLGGELSRGQAVEA